MRVLSGTKCDDRLHGGYSRAAARRRAGLVGLVALALPWVSGCAGFTRQPKIAGISVVSELESSFQDVIQRVLPSVVSLRVERRSTTPVVIFDERGNQQEMLVEETVAVNGSGMVLTEDGLLLTNEHVIHGADAVDVIFADGQKSRATVIARDTRGDLAVLRSGRAGLKPVRFADVRQLARGQWSIAVGNPLGIARDGQLSASVGVISNVSRDLPGLGEDDDRRYTNMVQTTAPISPGNSGGPLFNLSGEVIGIVTAMYARGGGDDGLAFAIPVTRRFRENVVKLARGGEISYGYVGATVRSMERSEARDLGTGDAGGALVISLDPDGPAARSGLQAGDVVVALEGRAVANAAEFVDRVGAAAVGSTMELGFIRDRTRSEVALRVARREGARVAMLR